MECGGELMHHSILATKIAESIFEFFEPLLAGSVTVCDEYELREEIMELCDEVVDFRTIIRRSKDQYVCEVPGRGGISNLVSECGLLVEAVAVESCKPNQASNEIAYTLFGGLVKKLDQGDGKSLVLEKAEVILKRR